MIYLTIQIGHICNYLPGPALAYGLRFNETGEEVYIYNRKKCIYIYVNQFSRL